MWGYLPWVPFVICITESGTESGTEQAPQSLDGAWMKAEGMTIRMTPSFSSHKLSSVSLVLPPPGTLCQAVRG